MSYENAPATKMLATHCCACGRPLLDAKSVELGIGPDCRKRLGFNMNVSEEARAEANRLVYQLALTPVDGRMDAAAACARLAELGFAKLADKCLEWVAPIRVTESDGRLVVKAPYCEAATDAWRGIRGRRWDRDAKCNSVPATERAALWRLLVAHYPGQVAIGPKGPFQVAAA